MFNFLSTKGDLNTMAPCDFCKKTREKILKSKEYVNHLLNIQKILEMKNKFLKKNELVYNYKTKLDRKNGK